ncbi:FHA domain-containing protein [Krasilnikovia sp. MM14-A1259]
MGSVLVHVPALRGRPACSLELQAGEVARFGRGEPQCPVGIELADPAVPRVAGEILSTGAYWQLSNLSREQSLVVENPEGAGEYFRVPPGRLAAPVPFEFSRVVLATRSDTLAFQVYAPDHTYLDPRTVAGRPGAATVSPFSLNEDALYFLVLVALCEPRLRDLSTVAVPTTPQVVERLRRHPDHAGITASAVGFHIDYLAGSKLRVKPPHHQRLDWKRETLVSVALRFGLVRESHLALLPPSTDGAGPGRSR